MQDQVACSDTTPQRRQLLASRMKAVRKAAIAAALIPLAAAVPSQASIQLYSSRVDSTVETHAGTFLYQFTVVNTTPGSSGSGPTIVDWELPLFDAADVEQIMSPAGWTYEIVTPNQTTPFYNNAAGPYGQYKWDWTPTGDPTVDPAIGGDPAAYGPTPDKFRHPTLVLHWYTTYALDDLQRVIPDNPILVQSALGGFSFASNYAPANAPYLSSWYRLPPRPGDPPVPGGNVGFVPRSPAFDAAVPEPTPLAALGYGLVSLAMYLRRRA